MRSSLSRRGRSLLKRKTIAIRPKPLQRKPPPEPVPFEVARLSSWERKVYYALRRRGISFQMQVNYAGGVGILGGMRVDFVLQDRPVIIRVQGPWHLFPAAQARDELQRQYLQALGYTVVDLYEEDIANLDRALEQKLGVPVRGR